MHRDECFFGAGMASASQEGQASPMEEQNQDDRPTLGDAMWRGLRGVCPACGESRLYASYMKQVERCTCCHVALGHLRSTTRASLSVL